MGCCAALRWAALPACRLRRAPASPPRARLPHTLPPSLPAACRRQRAPWTGQPGARRHHHLREPQPVWQGRQRGSLHQHQELFAARRRPVLPRAVLAGVWDSDDILCAPFLAAEQPTKNTFNVSCSCMYTAWTTPSAPPRPLCGLLTKHIKPRSSSAYAAVHLRPGRPQAHPRHRRHLQRPQGLRRVHSW